MADFSSLYPEIAIEVPGCPELLIEAAVRRAIRRFLRESEVWRGDLAAVDFDPAASLIDVAALAPDADTAVLGIDMVRRVSDGEPLTFMARVELDDEIADWTKETGTKPSIYTLESPTSARIVPVADDTVVGEIVFRVVFGVASTSTIIPDWIYDEYDEAIRYGALSNLMKTPGKDWTDVNLAIAHGNLFEASIVSASSDKGADFGTPDREVHYGGI